MPRREDLEQLIRESFQLIQEFEKIIQSSSDPKQQLHARKEIAKQRGLFQEHLAEYHNIVMPNDICRISSEFSTSAASRPRILLFDIDGTILGPEDSLQEGIGRGFLELLSVLANKGYSFVFITGNDFELQRKRILAPVINYGLGPSVFCFSDGGSRAFEFNEKDNTFQEIQSYSQANLMSEAHVQTVINAFETTLKDFLRQPGNDTLLRPDILWHKRTLDYLDIRVFPLRPSFMEGPLYQKFCEDILDLSRGRDIGSTVFHLEAYPNGLIIRAISRNPEFDVNILQNSIVQNLMFREEYSALAKPEVEVRGGRVVCQIALKPFNDDLKRQQFRDILEKKLAAFGIQQFSVLLGGRTTIDVQLKGVSKKKAIAFLIQREDMDPREMIYFGNEFSRYGNDRSIAEMSDTERPGLAINVGNILEGADALPNIVLEDGNGPVGTLNYLRFLLHEIS